MGRWALMQWYNTLVVTLITLVFIGYWYVYNFIFKHSIYAMVVFNVFFFLAMWSYLAASLTNPGTPACAEWQLWDYQSYQTKKPQVPHGGLPEASPGRCWTPGSPTFCRKCDTWRPERAHHCKSLGVCVLRMDHFCPWIGNCVGFRNHKQFVLMNFYISVASLIGLSTIREPNAIEALRYGMFGALGNNVHSWHVRMALSIAVLLCLMFTSITSYLFVHGVYTAALNITQIESKYKGSNPYVLPTAWENMRQLFGSYNILLFFPVHASGSHSSGTTFPCNKFHFTTQGGYGSLDSTTVPAAIV